MSDTTRQLPPRFHGGRLDIWTPELERRLAELWAAGWSSGKIAVDLASNISRSAVIGKIKRLKLPTPSLKLSALGIRSSSLSSRPAAKPRAPRGAKAAPQTRADKIAAVKVRAAALEGELTCPPAAPAEAIPHARLTKSVCHWPIGDPRSPDFKFCGAAVWRERASYCAEHSRTASSPTPARTTPPRPTHRSLHGYHR